MVSGMTKSQLLDTLQTERARWDALLNTIDEERMLQPDVEGAWSVKDVIAHIAAYEDWAASVLESAHSGKKFIVGDEGEYRETTDSRNARLYEMSRYRDLSEVRTASQQTFQRLVAAIQALSEEDLFEPHRFDDLFDPFLKDIPMVKLAMTNSYEHYREHIPPLQAWLESSAI